MQKKKKQNGTNPEKLYKNSRILAEGQSTQRDETLHTFRLLCSGVSPLLLIRTQFLNSQEKWKRKTKFAVERNHNVPVQYRGLFLAIKADAY